MFKSFIITIIVCTCWMPTMGVTEVTTHQRAPLFTLKSATGRVHDLSQLRDDVLTLLYFSNTEAHGHPDLLLTMGELRRRFQTAQFNLWGICNNSEKEVLGWVQRHGIEVPVLVDDGRVSALYNAAMVQPVLVVIGPELHLWERLQGPAAQPGAELILVARRLHQLGFNAAAQWLCERAVQGAPAGEAAKLLLASIHRQMGRYAEAEKLYFELSRLSGKVSFAGKEGLMAVYAAKEEYERALELAAQIARQAKKRAGAVKIQGDIVLQRGDLATAREHYKKALKKKEISVEEAAYISNQLGRIAMAQGKEKMAMAYFRDAVSLDPLYITARYNSGYLHQLAGEWERAQEVFGRLRKMEPASTYAAALAEQASAVLALRNDAEARRIMALKLGPLVERLTKGPWDWKLAEDEWTTEPLKLALLVPQEIAGLSERAGYPSVTDQVLRQRLGDSGRVKLIDALTIFQLLRDAEVSADVLANTPFITKLGRVLGTRIVGLGAFRHGVGASDLSYRLIDARLGKEIARIETKIFSHYDLAAKITRLADQILETAIRNTPLQAYVVEIKGERALLNLGAGQGVTVGRFFDVVEEQLFIEYKGKTLYPAPIQFARLEVVEVEENFCFARIVRQQRPIQRNDKAIEDISDLMMGADSQ
jgi:tetratricopeptide (TPR) repeat protein